MYDELRRIVDVVLYSELVLTLMNPLNFSTLPLRLHSGVYLLQSLLSAMYFRSSCFS